LNYFFQKDEKSNGALFAVQFATLVNHPLSATHIHQIRINILK